MFPKKISNETGCKSGVCVKVKGEGDKRIGESETMFSDDQ